MNLAVVCPLDCPLFRPLCFTNRSWLDQMTLDLHQTFTKWKLLSPKQIKYDLSIARARVHLQHVKTCTLFLPTLLVSFFDILKPFLTENKKNGGRIPDRYGQDATFTFYSFFSFIVRKTFKMVSLGIRKRPDRGCSLGPCPWWCGWGHDSGLSVLLGS